MSILNTVKGNHSEPLNGLAVFMLCKDNMVHRAPDSYFQEQVLQKRVIDGFWFEKIYLEL